MFLHARSKRAFGNASMKSVVRKSGLLGAIPQLFPINLA